jgi:CBS domain-containing protein
MHRRQGMSLERFCRKRVISCGLEDTATAIAQLMRDEHVGAVVVLSADGGPVGIVTDRDLVTRVLAEGRTADTEARVFMTPEPITVRASARLDDVVATMRAAGVRRLPIVGADGAVVGLVALDDITVLLAGELSASMAAVQSNRGP